MKIIGLTGGSGAGKGVVAQIMCGRGAGLVDADAIYRRLCATDKEMLSELDGEFCGVLTDSGTLDRPKLAATVFSDAGKLCRLNEITFPYIRRAAQEEIRLQESCPIVLLDAPTLFETGADSMCSDTVGVLADLEIRASRIMSRDNLSFEAAHARLAAQPADSFYIRRCGHILVNNGDIAALRRETDCLYKILTEGDNQNEYRRTFL